MITINYKNTIINYNNKLDYQINLENNNQEIIVIKNLNIDDKTFDVDNENHYIVSFILDKNQEVNLIYLITNMKQKIEN